MTPYALLGDPVAHSLSPRIHNAAFRALGIAAEYRAIQCRAEDVPQLMRTLAGGSVTIPHKHVAADACDHVSDVVVRTGACNTFYTRPDGLHGDNTDVIGFRQACVHHGVSLRGANALVLGAGGAAAAVVEALLQDGVARIEIRNRTAARARDLAARFADPRIVTSVHEFDVVVNATSLGLHGEAPTFDVRDGIVLDVVYRSAWVAELRARGITAFDGTEMLLRQAVAAFELWTGREAPLDVMRAALG